MDKIKYLNELLKDVTDIQNRLYSLRQNLEFIQDIQEDISYVNGGPVQRNAYDNLSSVMDAQEEADGYMRYAQMQIKNAIENMEEG